MALATLSVFSEISYYKRKNFAYDGSGLIIYQGLNRAQDAADGDTDWVIIKYTYDGNDNIESIRERNGMTWTDRADGW